VSLGAAIERYGADALRYFLLREVGFESDGNFSWDRFDARYTADLADTFGNLMSRSLSMIHRYRGGVVPEDNAADSSLERAGQETVRSYTAAMDALDLQQGAALIIELASRANRYIEETAPWKLVKENRDADLDTVLVQLVRTIVRLAILAAPFIPGKVAEIWSSLDFVPVSRNSPGWPVGNVFLSDLAKLAVGGRRVSKPTPLFPKPDSV
jgi:methionyl-tRNA synthetase